jgi:hypothetical protein
MVALEAWGLGRPVLANGRCDVLRGQCIRSNAGLYYETYDEFVESLYALESNGPLNSVLGRNGREYFRHHYAWPVIERKYLEMFQRLKGDSAATPSFESLPGWWARRSRRLPSANALLSSVPAGPALERPHAGAPPRHGERAEAAHARRA